MTTTGCQQSLVLIKPDALRRRLAGVILQRFERKGLVLRGLKLLRVSEALAAEHYREHRDKPFYEGLIRFITGGPLLAAVLEGRDAIAVCRRLVGATNGREAAPGTVRGDFGMSGRFNLVHASDSPAAAEREIGLFFEPEELVGEEPADHSSIYDWSDGTPL
jgi:nucleoside-diphosphate kinase